ncbi:MAG: alpha-hydroxy-acid oxidizing protein [Actinobacteria bacterium]|nr:alpha-hydroxy-acid oxidizing protein [Actinomycetota bacterium]
MDGGALERAASDRLGAERYAFLSSGAGRSITARENVEAWSSVRFRPRALVDVTTVSTETTMLGVPVAMPVGIAPMGFQKVAHAEGEAAMAKAAAAAHALMVVSTRSTTSFESIASASAGAPWWFQVYVLRDRSITRGLIERAIAAGCRALVVTADTPVVATKPSDAAAGALHLDMRAANLEGLIDEGVGRRDLPGLEQDPGVTYDIIGELAETELPVVVKGIVRGDDARRCVDAGAQGIVVSNHGGRQLDSTISTARALPEVVDAVGDAVEVYVDGGVRSGSDVVKALALGARAAFIGRTALWSLALGGSQGVADLLAELRIELSEAMMLAGAPQLGDVTADLLIGR